MNLLALLIGALFGVALSFCASGIETGSYCLNRVRLRVWSEQNRPGARRLAGLIARHGDLVITLLLTNVLADYICTACVTALLLQYAVASGSAEFWTTLLVTPVLLVFGGILPKDRFRREADRWMYPLALPLHAVVRLVQATGFVWLMRSVTRAFARWIDPTRDAREAQVLPRANVRLLLHEGAALGGLSSFQRDLIDRVMNLAHVRVGSVMIPRQRAATVALDVPRDDFLRIARMAHFSRLPVYRDDPRQIIGVVAVFDVLTDPQRQPIAAHVRPPITLTEQVNVSTALLQLQQARETMAIVQDRAGRCLGILTLKDLVEEIVGDLEAW